MSLIERDRSVLVVIDLQERLLAEIPAALDITAQSVKLLRVARELEVPVLATEQYPKGLGPTVASVAEAMDTAAIEKLSFGCMDEPFFVESLDTSERQQLIIVGAETHVCVLQTALRAVERYEVFVVLDAVASRKTEAHEAAITRMRAEGVGIVTAEMVIFEWLQRAGTPEFKRVLPLIKEA